MKVIDIIKKISVKQIIIAVLACVVAFSAYKTVSILLGYNAASNIYKDLGSEFVKPTYSDAGSEFVSVTDPDAKDTPPITVDFNSLKKVNENIIGWIYCADTAINYPIVKTENAQDYDYYLSHLINGKKNSAGTVFMDYRNRQLCGDFNSILYGHSMKNGTMFAHILRYRNQEFYDSHPYMWIYTPDAVYRLNVAAGYSVNENSADYGMFSDSDAVKDYVKRVSTDSGFKTGADLDAAQNIVQLSTCFAGDDMRFVLVCTVEKYD